MQCDVMMCTEGELAASLNSCCGDEGPLSESGAKFTTQFKPPREKSCKSRQASIGGNKRLQTSVRQYLRL
jgi:hypothetical protein